MNNHDDQPIKENPLNPNEGGYPEGTGPVDIGAEDTEQQYEFYQEQQEQEKNSSPKWPFALIGVAVIALIIFIVTRFTGGGGGQKMDVIHAMGNMTKTQVGMEVEEELGIKELMEASRTNPYGNTFNLTLEQAPASIAMGMPEDMGLHLMAEQDPSAHKGYIDITADLMGQKLNFAEIYLDEAAFVINSQMFTSQPVIVDWSGDVYEKMQGSSFVQMVGIGDNEVKEIADALEVARESMANADKYGSFEDFISAYPELERVFQDFFDAMELEDQGSIDVEYGGNTEKADAYTLTFTGEDLKQFSLGLYDFFMSNETFRKEFNITLEAADEEMIIEERADLEAELDEIAAKNENIAIDLNMFNDKVIRMSTFIIDTDDQQLNYLFTDGGPVGSDDEYTQEMEMVFDKDGGESIRIVKIGSRQQDMHGVNYMIMGMDGGQDAVIDASLSWDKGTNGILGSINMMADQPNGILFIMDGQIEEIEKGKSIKLSIPEISMNADGESLVLSSNLDLAPISDVTVIDTTNAIDLFTATEAELQKLAEDIMNVLFFGPTGF